MENLPNGGFYSNEAITVEECMKGMTIWAANAAFQEMHSGSLEKGKDATFVIFDLPVVDAGSYRANFARMTFIAGKKVYSVE
jgi:predicted amidohydrolase YtcJ